MPGELDFTGKTILVTGSGRNIGRAIILEFARRGANVIINARSNVQQAQAVENEAKQLGAQSLVVMGDTSQLETIGRSKRGPRSGSAGSPCMSRTDAAGVGAPERAGALPYRW